MMNQHELSDFWDWCFEHVGVEEHQCDESDHYYFNGHYVGGYAGDTHELFIANSYNGDQEMANKLVAMYDAWNKYEGKA